MTTTLGGHPVLRGPAYRDVEVDSDELGVALWIGRDRIYCTPTRNGVPMCPPNDDRRVPGLALLGVHAVQPGVLSGLSDALDVDVLEPARNYAAEWRPMQPGAHREISPAAPLAPTTPPTEVPYPETVAEISLGLRGSLPLWLTVTNHRLSLSRQQLAQSSPVHLEPLWPQPHAHIGIPLARFPIIRAGRLAEMPRDWHATQLAPDTHTELRTDMVDGPAVWLWGPLDEFVICHPEADRLAADIRLRQQVGLLYPIAIDSEAERATWHNFYALAPVDDSQGRAIPTPPPYAPVEPTLVPPGTWTPAG
ncbi:MAG: hypothetical protein ACRDQ5_11260 [Sciscionella sp.]